MKMGNMPGSHQENVTEGALVLLGVVVALTICWAPPLIKIILKETFQTYQLEGIQVLNQVGHCTVTINSSINFLIYFIVGKQYREHFKSAFSCSSTSHPPHAAGKENIKSVTNIHYPVPIIKHVSGFRNNPVIPGQSLHTAQENEDTRINSIISTYL